MSYKSDQNSKLNSAMFRRITVGLKGGMLPVASVAERLLKPDVVLLIADWLVLPLGGC